MKSAAAVVGGPEGPTERLRNPELLHRARFKMHRGLRRSYSANAVATRYSR